MLVRLLQSNPPQMRSRPAAIPLPLLEAQLETTIAAIWSRSTWNQFRSLWQRFHLFATLTLGEEDVSPDHAAALFVVSMNVSVQTKHTYIRNFITIFRKLEWTHQELTLLDTALRTQGCLVPMTQAKPMTQADAQKLFRSLPTPHNYLVMLAWKTASRWDEIARLTPHSFLQSDNPMEIIIYFGSETKASRTRPFRPDLFAVIRGAYTKELQAFLYPRIRTTSPHQPLFPIPTATIREMLDPWGYSAHSMKRGAILHLLHVLPEGSPHLSLLPLLGKHAPHYHVLNDMEIRYGAEHQIGAARHLGTGILTCLL